MIDISVMVEGQQGLNWGRWKRLVAEVDALGFYGFYRSDHFTDPRPPDVDSLEMLVSMTYLAGNSERVRFGPLVSPVSFRDPVMLARQAAALDDLSGGRMVLGVGAGWQEREHNMFGYPLGDMRTRMNRLEEALQVITRLLRSDGPVTFEGEHYTLRDAMLLPRPQRPGDPPILIGGSGPKRTLPLVARYADIWNSLRRSPEEFRELNTRLDELVRAEGRELGEVRRTLFTEVIFATDESDLEGLLSRRLMSGSDHAGKTSPDLFEELRARNTIVGTPAMIQEQVAAYEAAGVQEIVLRWTKLDDLERLHAFGEAVV